LFSSLIGCAEEDSSEVVLAEVNGQEITLEDYRAEMEGLPEEMRLLYQNDPQKILQRLILMTLLLQEACRRGLIESADLHRRSDPRVQKALEELLRSEGTGRVEVADEEIEAFYAANRSLMEGASLEQVREVLRGILRAQKEQESVGAFIGMLHTNAAIQTYPERLPSPSPPVIPSATEEEFHKALKSGRPTVADFGSNLCIPCIRLRPVLKAVKDAHGDRLNVLYLEVDEHKGLARKHRIQLVPTVIFFNADGKEVKRHMGYMDRKAMEEMLRKLGFVKG
jgi:thioredoxin 1